MVKTRTVMVLYDNGDRVSTSGGRFPDYHGHLNEFDRAILDMISETRPVAIYTIDTDIVKEQQTYTQTELEAAVEEAYQMGREDGYESALDNIYNDLH